MIAPPVPSHPHRSPRKLIQRRRPLPPRPITQRPRPPIARMPSPRSRRRARAPVPVALAQQGLDRGTTRSRAMWDALQRHDRETIPSVRAPVWVVREQLPEACPAAGYPGHHARIPRACQRPAGPDPAVPVRVRPDQEVRAAHRLARVVAVPVVQAWQHQPRPVVRPDAVVRQDEVAVPVAVGQGVAVRPVPSVVQAADLPVVASPSAPSVRNSTTCRPRPSVACGCRAAKDRSSGFRVGRV
jgi:hypothetical protein